MGIIADTLFDYNLQFFCSWTLWNVCQYMYFQQ